MNKKIIVLILILVILLSGCSKVGYEKLKKPKYGKGFQKKPWVKSTQKLPKTKPTSKIPVTPAEETLRVAGKWEQLNGLDGGDMHFIESTSEGILFASHGFSGVWRSVDGGQSWKMIKQNDFVDVHFYDIQEFDGKIYAGSNKGLWVSYDDGESWEKVQTGFKEVDSGKYHVVSLTVYRGNLFFTAVLDKPYRSGGIGKGLLLYLDGRAKKFYSPADDEIVVAAKDPYLFISSPYSGLYVYNGSWRKILDKRTTKIYIDDDYNLYIGTIEDFYYIGVFDGNNWNFKHITLNLDPKKTIFYFIVPDPLNNKRLWFGAGGISTFYSFSGKWEGSAFIGVGCWDGKRLYNSHFSPNFATSITFLEGGSVQTSCGVSTKYALITQGGRNSVMKTDDGGVTWKRSYEGVYGDTINEVNAISSGILKDSIVITAVSGIEIAQNNGDSWLDIDFTLGKFGGKLPGYSWCAVSPNEKVMGKYDLLISTGYPSPFKGDGVFAVDISCIESGGGLCIKKLIEGPHYEMVIVDDRLYAGNMDSGVDVLDLKTLTTSKLDITDPAPIVRYFDGKIFVETYKSGYSGDSWRWTGKSGEIYVCDSSCKVIYNRYAISFSVKDNQLIALRKDAIVYKSDIYSNDVKEIRLPRKLYTDMVVNWEKGVIFVSTFNEGVFYITLDQIKSGSVELKPLNDGLLTLKIRNLEYYNGYIFCGTEGNSVYRMKPSFYSRNGT
ncbi:MAG TPA: hypothetical protein ENG16_02765 [Archaeoglobus sp.]|nr:hypothetical protein [Archaeoglobus sp.]